MTNSDVLRSIAITAAAVLVVAFAVFGMRGKYVGTREGKADENYLQSTDCRVCHEEHYTSWRRTHHSRMTQEAGGETVQGDFERENTLEYLGVKAKMTRDAEGFYFELTNPDGSREKHKIERTVGSRRIEQYLIKNNGQYYRFPIAYDLMNRRWMSLNGSFFYPDSDNFDQHLAQWDVNCVFCHNVKAQPNFDFRTRLAKTEVSELGIACGACHAQGAEHAELAANPLRRNLWRFGGGDEKKIVDPLGIDTDRSMMICGHCHGQRMPEPQTRIREILTKGDPFDAGDDLSKYYKPIHADSKLGEMTFETRFWPDGSPRLTAYEYQGLKASPCFTKGKAGARINCLSCHTMHGGDVKGQITDEMRTNLACTQCHTEYKAPEAVAKHTKHEADSAGSSCYACHMPKVVYGVQTFHPTHQISVPRPEMTAEKGVPNACSQCHVDKSLNWAINSSKEMWPEYFKDAKPSSNGEFDRPETIRGLFAGDALTRAMMADALLRHGNSDIAAPFLLESFSTDNYPIVRYFAANGLSAWFPAVTRPDYLLFADDRKPVVEEWRRRFSAERVRETEQAAAALRAVRKNVDLEVGE
ncbi:MAG: hypothetical protein IPM50_13710 [Acidobacteriota bacterium]|nr:MAG: hypothetical protein IPM50_13710 [Acidobacteriota bacterium]